MHLNAHPAFLSSGGFSLLCLVRLVFWWDFLHTEDGNLNAVDKKYILVTLCNALKGTDEKLAVSTWATTVIIQHPVLWPILMWTINEIQLSHWANTSQTDKHIYPHLCQLWQWWMYYGLSSKQLHLCKNSPNAIRTCVANQSLAKGGLTISLPLIMSWRRYHQGWVMAVFWQSDSNEFIAVIPRWYVCQTKL